jgi:cytochrome c biogenesis protein CcmG/thiol:disulfide interchange protein DsbE
MPAPSEPDPGPTDDPVAAASTPGGGPGAPGGRARRRLDRRTVAICVCIALVAALGAGLLATVVLGDGGSPDAGAGPSMTVVQAGAIDRTDLVGVRLLTVDGKATSLGRRLGPKPLVVNLWAQSCVPCIKEMPLLEKVSRSDSRVSFLGVDVLDRLDKAKAMAKQTGITYPWVRDPNGDFGLAARTAGLPDTLLVDTDGTVLATKLGPFDDEAELRSWLDDHLA